MYDKLVHMFKANNANQVLFFKDQLKNLKKGSDESVQSYFLKLTEIKNNLLAIGETIADREMVSPHLEFSHPNGMYSTLPFSITMSYLILTKYYQDAYKKRQG